MNKPLGGVMSLEAAKLSDLDFCRWLNASRMIGVSFAAVAVLVACGGSSGGGVGGSTPAGSTACTPVAGASVERVTTSSGVVRGVLAGATWSYRKVPYAAAPV